MVTLVCASLAGCGDDDDGGDPDTTADTTSTTETTITETAVTETTVTETVATDSGSDSGETVTTTDVAPDGDTTTPPSARVIFDDDYGDGVAFKDFGGATNALSIDASDKHAGTSSLKIAVPAAGYTGGAFAVDTGEDLSGWDAVTFWAKANVAATLNVVGVGNDATTATLQAEWNAVPLTTSWQRFVVPLPDPAALDAATGLFHFAEGAEAAAYTIWIDDLRFEVLPSGTLGDPQPAIATETVSREVGATFAVNGASVTVAVDGTNQTLALARAWLDYSSSAEGVATVDAAGVVTAVAVGTAEITASLAGTPAAGKLTFTVTDAQVPGAAAPTPTVDADDVVSLFSNAYTNATVDTWSAVWDQADVADVQIAGNDTKKYTNLNFAGVEFTSATIDASALTHFHIDVWTPDGTSFKVKLVDFGANGVYNGPDSDDREHELTFDASSSPALAQKQWVSLDIPLASFTGLTTRAHLAQMVLSSSNATVYVDNVYLYASAAPTEPTSAAPTPTQAAGGVTSVFSNAYTNVTIDTWSAVWDQADVADVQVAGNDTKKYTNLNYAGIEFTSSQIDASAKTHFHMDVWSPDGTLFKVKLVDFGADGTYDGPGVDDDREHELTFDSTTTPAFVTGQWVSLDLPLSSFTNLTTRGHLAQLIIVSSTATVFVDNVYFY